MLLAATTMIIFFFFYHILPHICAHAAVELFAMGWLRKGPISQLIQFGAKHMLLYFINYDQELAKKVIPDYELGCKRLLFTHEFLPIFLKDNCHLNTNPIEAITEKGRYTYIVIPADYEKKGRKNLFCFHIFQESGRKTGTTRSLT